MILKCFLIIYYFSDCPLCWCVHVRATSPPWRRSQQVSAGRAPQDLPRSHTVPHQLVPRGSLTRPHPTLIQGHLLQRSTHRVILLIGHHLAQWVQVAQLQLLLLLPHIQWALVAHNLSTRLQTVFRGLPQLAPHLYHFLGLQHLLMPRLQAREDRLPFHRLKHPLAWPLQVWVAQCLHICLFPVPQHIVVQPTQVHT